MLLLYGHAQIEHWHLVSSTNNKHCLPTTIINNLTNGLHHHHCPTPTPTDHHHYDILPCHQLPNKRLPRQQRHTPTWPNATLH
jgi:hypothetical protein